MNEKITGDQRADGATKPRIAWTIAGSDSGGGAGIQADLATFRDFGVHGCSVITAITGQNSFAVGYVEPVSRKALAAQINALDCDLPAAAIKVGMLANNDIVASVAKYLSSCRGIVVYDPVLHASNGASLFGDEFDDAGRRLLREQLLPCVDLLTPNRFEAEFLLDRKLAGIEDIEQAARDLVALGPRSVLIKGGHFETQGSRRLDYWSDGVDGFWLAGPNIDTVHGHGTGCTLSSAIAAALARGFALADALVLAKMYVAAGLRSAVQLGGGPGAVAHAGWPRNIDDLPVLSRTLPTANNVGGSSGCDNAFPDCDGELGLYPVVDSAEWIERLLPLGVKTIQLRIKQQAAEQLEAEIRRAVDISHRHGARLFINDHWQLAIRCGAYGVHLGQEDLDSADLAAIRAAGLRLGVSNHSYYELARAHGVRPSYLALGPIFPTTTKVMKFADQGLAQLEQWAALLKPAYTLTAIGGIGPERVAAVMATGVGSCAMVSAITQADDYTGVVRDLLARIDANVDAVPRMYS
jgi:hydroxymethylpyrimidine kinase/phosphomethylpyrimidine kinase/thiamine-phosphate diphosphorylase